MPKSTATCNSIVNLMYRATAWANVADNASSSPLTNTYVSLHTATLSAGTPGGAAMGRPMSPAPKTSR